MDYFVRAKELERETVEHRRYLHENAEVGMDLPVTVEYISKELCDMGIEAKRCGHGIEATVGKPGKVILLRADMDALPMREESGESFACKNGESAHACGHDFHAAMLLTAAKMLKENETNLCGTVKLMFQPAEEILEGAKDMISCGVLENPKVDVALAFHVAAGNLQDALVMYNDEGAMMYSADMFEIRIKGKGAHSAYPNFGIDPINIGNRICLELQSLEKKLSPKEKKCMITVCRFEAGNTGNVIPDEALLEGTVRAIDKELQEKAVSKIKEVVKRIAKEFGGSAEIELNSGVPPLVCDSALTNSFVRYMSESEDAGFTFYKGISASASEDFACVASFVPSAFMYLSAGFDDERGAAPAHNPKVKFNENVCKLGSAAFAHCATRWLEENRGA